MRVLYAIQGTGNGHLSRAREMVPALRENVDVDLLVSGTQSEVQLPWKLTYQYKGFSFCYNRKGGVSKVRSLRENFSSQLMREIHSLPVEHYDLVINDFEPVSAWAAKRKGVPCIAMSHQAAYLSQKSPRPFVKDRFGEAVLKRYAPADLAVGFHFEEYDSFIYTPVIRSEVRALTPRQGGYFVVYLPAYKDEVLTNILSTIPEADWIVFSRHATQPASTSGNVKIEPIRNDRFLERLEDCQGLLTGGGFEAPAEAMFLGKKVFSIPVKGQYEQQCNAAALRKLGCSVASKLTESLIPDLRRWVEDTQPEAIEYPDQTRQIIENVLRMGREISQMEAVA